MQKIRIMHVVHSLGIGGSEEGIRKLLNGLDSNEFEQVVCTVASSPAIDARSGARVLSLARPDNQGRLVIGKLARIMRSERPDLVHSRNWSAIEAIPAARVAGIKVAIHSEHGLESDTFKSQPWRRKVARRVLYGWADRVFAVSAGLKQYYLKQLGTDFSNMNVIPNGVDTERFRPDASKQKFVRQALGAAPETVVIGTVGRLDPVKDHATLLNAVAGMYAEKEIRLVIVGDGPNRHALEASLSERAHLGKRTSFIGLTHDVVSYLSALDIFVLPSLAEGMSNALLEAMSVGVACVATRVGGNPELIVDRSSGLLFEPGDARELAACLQTLTANSGLRQQLGMNARQRVAETFSLSAMLNRYADLYRELILNRAMN